MEPVLFVALQPQIEVLLQDGDILIFRGKDKMTPTARPAIVMLVKAFRIYSVLQS